MAGLSLSAIEERGIPLPLLATALAELATSGGDHIAYVLQFPRIVMDIPEQARSEARRAEVS